MKIDACDRDVFDLAGPKHLCNIRLSSVNKQAVVAALVQAVYVSEVDRQQKRQGVYALAPKWWNELGYVPVSFLNEAEHSEPIIGIVFKRADFVEEGYGRGSAEETCTLPAMVVALRGTLLYHEKSLQDDMLANLQVFLHQLHTTARFATALKTIRHAISEVGAENLTIAGHSLGAAIALLAGQTLAYESVLLNTHLFNPPFPSPPLERIKSKGWKLALNLTGMAFATSLSYLLLDEDNRQTSAQAFLALKVWQPHLYINMRDPVCSSYISYFNSHDFMQQIGAGPLAQLAAPVSLRGTIQQYFLGDCKAFHLIPCAHLYVMNKKCAKLVRAHGLHQWWWPDLEVDYQKVSVGLDEETSGRYERLEELHSGNH